MIRLVILEVFLVVGGRTDIYESKYWEVWFSISRGIYEVRNLG